MAFLSKIKINDIIKLKIKSLMFNDICSISIITIFYVIA